MNKNEINLNKKLAKITGLKGLIFAAGLLTLMGCGRTVVDETVTPQPTTSVETTIDDPEVDVPVVEPTTDPTTTPVEEDKPTPTFVMTGENNYTMYIDCEDNTNDPVLQELRANTDSGEYSHFIDTMPEILGFSNEIMYGIVANNGGMGVSNPVGLNFDYFKDMPIDVVRTAGAEYYDSRTIVISDDPSAYPSDYFVVTSAMINSDDPEVDMLRAACAVYRMCLDKANGNFACALEMYNKGLDVWDQAMQECAANTGLTEAEIYASYTPDFVYANSSVAVENPNYYKEVLSYVSTNELYRLVLDDVDHIYGTYYRLERTESLDKAKVYQR